MDLERLELVGAMAALERTEEIPHFLGLNRLVVWGSRTECYRRKNRPCAILRYRKVSKILLTVSPTLAYSLVLGDAVF